MSSNSILEKVFDQLRQQCEKTGEKVHIALDLDSTLFNVGPRMTKILFDFSQKPEFQKKYSKECLILEQLQHHPRDWGISHTLRKAGLTDHEGEFYRDLQDFWALCFFSNEYLHADEPYEGALEMTNELHNLGAHLHYLTGRDLARMGRGTEEVLRKWSFPLHEETAVMALKPHKDIDDAQFKCDYFKKLEESSRRIFFFDNDPKNLILAAEQNPVVELVFYDSVHPGEHSPPENAHVLKTFKF